MKLGTIVRYGSRVALVTEEHPEVKPAFRNETPEAKRAVGYRAPGGELHFFSGDGVVRIAHVDDSDDKLGALDQVDVYSTSGAVATLTSQVSGRFADVFNAFETLRSDVKVLTARFDKLDAQMKSAAPSNAQPSGAPTL